MFTLENILIAFSILIIISVIASKASSRFGIPALLLFLFIGMLAGSEGIGGIYFDNPRLAQDIGVVALIFILFSGGLETEWKTVRPVLREGVLLATAGVLLTALLVGWFAMRVLHFSVYEGLLLGAIVSSTDAAAVFAVLRSRKVSLQGCLRPLLELESGSNDPMAVFLTIGLIGIITGMQKSLAAMVPLFIMQMGLGIILGYGTGRAMVYVLNRIKLGYDGLYPVLTMAMVLFTYAVTNKVGGSGFLAVYAAGLVMGNSVITEKRYLIHFHGGLAWLMQIAMFLTLGLLVFPSGLVEIASAGLLTALFLILVARPVSVFISMAFSRFNFREKALVSWVGLKGSVPIILATFPLLAGLHYASVMFNIVFFAVLISTLVQGTTISYVARLLRVAAPFTGRKKYPIELETTDDLNTRLIDLTVPYDSWMVGKTVAEIGLPADSLITLIARSENFIVPAGHTVVEAGDVLLTIVNNNNIQEITSIFSRKLPQKK